MYVTNIPLSSSSYNKKHYHCSKRIVSLTCEQSNSFCACCGVDITRFSHEFWCRYSLH
ncbi:hypothetical protein BCR42DRAFT_407326 [Absidia repens]|uniref:Uncharacterized protein n=1 Tax=Absidia repens TaxID=90262 RepID=A0A1X2ITQ0_9FUNG|nr:hypothetical protein BCR42DRAFT_407326 [Absidia repens]